MRLLIVDCGASRLCAELTMRAVKWAPKPEFCMTIHANMNSFNRPAFKKQLNELAPDMIMVIPEPYYANTDFHGKELVALMEEVVRTTEINSGKVAFFSNADAIGLSQLRSENAIPIPTEPYGLYLLDGENVARNTPRHYIFRTPYLLEDVRIQTWIVGSFNLDKWLPQTDNLLFTVANQEEIARTSLLKIEDGWFGTFHLSPNDRVELFILMEMERDDFRIPDRSLTSSQHWRLSPSEILWDDEAARLESNVLL